MSVTCPSWPERRRGTTPIALDLDAASTLHAVRMTRETTAIEVTALTKAFGDQPVLRGIDLTVPTGTVYALIGPNGAGKTTMVRILSTLIGADGGTARVAGF